MFFVFCFFPPPPEPVLYKLGSPGGLFVLPEVLTVVLRPSFVLFSQAFPLSFSHCHFGLLFPILTTYQDHDDPEAGHHGGLSAADSEGAGPAM